MKKKKTENEENKMPDKAATAQDKEIVRAYETVLEENYSGELNDPHWSVISFVKCEATDLIYQEAVKKIEELVKKGISGLCIVTNQAAQKVRVKVVKGKKKK